MKGSSRSPKTCSSRRRKDRRWYDKLIALAGQFFPQIPQDLRPAV